MTTQEFRTGGREGLSGPLLALWWDGQGAWEEAHTVAQDVNTADGAWVHAYLHRKEGDAGNAAYWYRRAGRPVSRAGLEEEWAAMVEELLQRAAGEHRGR